MSPNSPWFKLPEPPQLDSISGVANTPVVIIGCGLAGCHTAYQLATRGIKVIMLDAGNAIAAGASGNSAGIVKPFVTRSPGLSDQFYQAAFQYLLGCFDADKGLRASAQFAQCGVLQLVERDYPSSRAYTTCSAKQASVLAGVSINSPAIFFHRGGWLNPAALCQVLVDHQNIEVRLQHKVCSIKNATNQWSIEYVESATNRAQCTTEKSTASVKGSFATNRLDCHTLILANGTGANQLGITVDLPITAARGQTSEFALTHNAALNTVVTGKRYAIPNGNSVVVGASFSRDEQSTQLLTSEHKQNLTGLNTLLPSLQIEPVAQSGFCGIRATTPDRLPVVGPMPRLSDYQQDYARVKDGLPDSKFPNASYEHGLFIIGGFGSRGIVSSAYCAKLLVDYLCNSVNGVGASNDANSDSLSHWSTLLHPGRFKIRDLKRDRGAV